MAFQPGLDEALYATMDEDIRIVDYCMSYDGEQLGIVSICEDSLQNIEVPENKSWEGHPKFSSKGNWLAYLRKDSERQHCFGKDDAGCDLENFSTANNCWLKLGEGSNACRTIDWAIKPDVWVMSNREDLTHKNSSSQSSVPQAVNLTSELGYPVINYFWSCNEKCLIALIVVNGTSELVQVNYNMKHGQAPEQLNIKHWGKFTFNKSYGTAIDNIRGWSKECRKNVKHPILSCAKKRINQVVPFNSGKSILLSVNSLSSQVERLYICNRESTFVDWEQCDEKSLPYLMKDKYADGQIIAKHIAEPDKKNASTVRQINIPSYETEGENDLYGLLVSPPENLVKECKNELGVEVVCPIVIYVHGGPSGVTDNGFNRTIYDIAMKGYVVVAPNPTGSTSFGKEFRQAVKLNWGSAPYYDLLDMIGHFQSKNYEGIDASRVFLIGDSLWWLYGQLV